MKLRAETAYLFRHAVLREAAYQLQTPRDRTALHALALQVIEAVLPTADLPALAAEMVAHARAAMAGDQAGEPKWRRKEAQYLALSLGHARDTYNHPRALADLADLRDHPEVEPAGRLRYRREYGSLLNQLGRNTESASELRLAVELAQAAANATERVLAQQGLAHVYRVIQRVPEAETLFNEAIAAASAIGDRNLAASVSRGYAMLLLRTGRTQEAHSTLQSAADVHRDADPRELAADLANLGLLHHQTGNLQAGETALREALGLLTAAGDLRSVARVMGNLSNIVADRADSHGAQRLLEQAGELFRRAGDLQGLAMLDTNLGSLQREAGQVELAEASYRRSAELCRDLGETRQQAYAEAGLAAILNQRGQLAQALNLLRASISTMRQFNDLHNVGSLLCELAVVERRQGLMVEAEGHLWEALKLNRDTGFLRMESSALAELGVVHFARGQLAAGMALLDEAVNVCDASGLAINAAMWRARRAACRLLLCDEPGASADLKSAGVALAEGQAAYRLELWLTSSIYLAAWNAEMEPPSLQLARLESLMSAEADQLARLGQEGNHDWSRQLERAASASNALSAAVHSGRPALLFCGYAPAVLPPEQRLALLEYMARNHPQRLQLLRERNPELMMQLVQGTQGVSLPDWANPSIPGFTPRATT